MDMERDDTIILIKENSRTAENSEAVESLDADVAGVDPEDAGYDSVDCFDDRLDSVDLGVGRPPLGSRWADVPQSGVREGKWRAIADDPRAGDNAQAVARYLEASLELARALGDDEEIAAIQAELDRFIYTQGKRALSMPSTEEHDRLAFPRRPDTPFRPQRAVPRADEGALVSRNQIVARDMPSTLERTVSLDLDALMLDPHLIALREPEGATASRFRQLDFKLRQIAQRRPARTIAITSPVDSAASAITAISLALVRAESPHARVMLVDLNFRQPEVLGLLGLEADVGLQHAILGQAPLEEIMVRVEGTECYLLGSAPEGGSPSRLFKNPALTRIIGTIYDSFDLVVMVMPPVIPMADINQIDHLIDLIVMVATAGQTSGPDLHRAAGTIDTDKLAGVVLSETSA